MTPTATTQLNVRLPKHLRESGDRALADIGLTSSAAIRRLWEKAANRGQDLAEIAAVLTPGDSGLDLAPCGEEDELLSHGWQIVEEGMRSLGLANRSEQTEQLPYEDLLVEALNERMRSRGVV